MAETSSSKKKFLDRAFKAREVVQLRVVRSEVRRELSSEDEGEGGASERARAET